MYVSVNFTTPTGNSRTPALYMQEEKMITAEKRSRWLRHVERWKESGLSVNKYCIENGINKNSFRYWIERDKKNLKSEKFIKLTIPKPSISGKEAHTIILKYGEYEIKLPLAFEESELNRILNLLEGRI